MSEITRVGVDLAKQVIQVHAVDQAEAVVTRRAVPRRAFLDWCARLPPGCLVAMEACTGAHHWARLLSKLGLKVRLIAPHLVTPYRRQGKTGKNDANDAAAVCEAASRPDMHFVPVKTVEQQGILSVHVMRQGWEKDRTACINRIRALLAEFGLVLAKGPEKLRLQLPELLEDATNDMPGVTRLAIQRAVQHWRQLDEDIGWCDQQIQRHARTEPRAQQAQTLLGIGPIGASALVASVSDFSQFTSGRQFAAWLGITPSQNSSGGRTRLGGITKHGDEYLRMLLVTGAKAAIHRGKPREERVWLWAKQLSERAGWQKAAVALAAKNARILWAMFTRGQSFVPNHTSVKPT
ncbi:MAG TPA: IS110 family transposase [Ramlibacter sp.]|jgi:transposase